jgi:hypothetical protein
MIWYADGVQRLWAIGTMPYVDTRALPLLGGYRYGASQNCRALDERR